MPNKSIEIVAERPLSRIFMEHAAGAVLSLLPARWRSWWDSEPSDAVVSGTIEAGVASYFFLHVLLLAIDAEVKGLSLDALAGVAGTHGDAGVMALGPVIIFGLLLKPLTFALALTAVDGYVRAATALISKEVVPSVWFGVVEWVISNARMARRTPS